MTYKNLVTGDVVHSSVIPQSRHTLILPLKI